MFLLTFIKIYMNSKKNNLIDSFPQIITSTI